MTTAHVVIDRDFTLSDIDRRLFGAFVEHMGRCVYTGIFEPGHPQADEQGFRKDVLALTRELGATIVRYPGGNFVSGYDWEDGVGPVEARPKRLDLAWGTLEPNTFGTNEFIDWCRKAEIEPMFAVNLGTRGIDDARRFVEYCNHPGGTMLSDLRRSHGYEQPHRIKYWCLGNEVDASWQIGAKRAPEYGLLAQEAAKVMLATDPTIKLTACGSSYRAMETFARWEYEVLDRCFKEADFISLHTYFDYKPDTSEDYLSNLAVLDAYISEVVAVADAVAATRRSPKRIMLAFDEWNGWVRTRTRGLEQLLQPGWPEHPRLVEEVYTAQDALLIGGALITLLNHADRVKVACLAQLVNVLGPIMTEPGGPAWRQTIFHPFALTSRLARGKVLRTAIGEEANETPHLHHCATYDASSSQLCLLVLNGSVDGEAELKFDLRGFGQAFVVGEAHELHHPDLQAANTKEQPDTVVPQPLSGIEVSEHRVTLRLKPSSWNIVALVPRQQ